MRCLRAARRRGRRPAHPGQRRGPRGQRLGLGAALAFAGTSHRRPRARSSRRRCPPGSRSDPDTVVRRRPGSSRSRSAARCSRRRRRRRRPWVGRRRVLRRDLPRQHLPAGHPHRRLRPRLATPTRRPPGRSRCWCLGAGQAWRALRGGGGGPRRAMIVDLRGAERARRRAADRDGGQSGLALRILPAAAPRSTARIRGRAPTPSWRPRGDQGDLLPALPTKDHLVAAYLATVAAADSTPRPWRVEHAGTRPSSRRTRTGSRRSPAGPGSTAARSSTPPPDVAHPVRAVAVTPASGSGRGRGAVVELGLP